MRLAMLGHRVCLVESHRFPRHHVGEALTKGVLPMLDVLRLRTSVLASGALRASQAIVRWGKLNSEKIEWAQDAAGLLVDRGQFDELLLGAALGSGVTVIQPARARAARRDACGWQVDVETEGKTCRIDADYLVDASGRRGCLHGPHVANSPPTLALCGHLRTLGRTGPTLIEALPDGWCWGASIPSGSFSTMIFLEPDALRQNQTGTLEEFWRSQLSRTKLFADLSGATLIRPLEACNATTGFVADPIGTNFVRVGEANFTLDPLSSTGVEKAIQTGLLAAIALHTMILRPARKELCRRFYSDRQREAVTAHAGWAKEFYAQVSCFADRPFWRARSAWTSGGPPTRIPSNPSPRVSHLGLNTRVRLSDQARFVEEPCIVGDEMCARMALLHPSLKRPVAFVEGVELERLLTMSPLNEELGRIISLWATQLAPQSATRIALWLLENHILESAP
jgi:hypothetical protein